MEEDSEFLLSEIEFEVSFLLEAMVIVFHVHPATQGTAWIVHIIGHVSHSPRHRNYLKQERNIHYINNKYLHTCMLYTINTVKHCDRINVSTELEMTSDARQKGRKACYIKHCMCGYPVILIWFSLHIGQNDVVRYGVMSQFLSGIRRNFNRSVDMLIVHIIGHVSHPTRQHNYLEQEPNKHYITMNVSPIHFSDPLYDIWFNKMWEMLKVITYNIIGPIWRLTLLYLGQHKHMQC